LEGIRIPRFKMFYCRQVGSNASEGGGLEIIAASTGNDPCPLEFSNTCMNHICVLVLG
jgi:hypothetical protein